MKEKDIKEVFKKFCLMRDWEWIDQDDENLNVEQKMIKDVMLFM